MHPLSILQTLTFSLFLVLSLSLYTVPPVWVTSPYIKTGTNNVIASLTGNSSLPTATIPFPGNAFLSVPNIGYGASAYWGNDAMGSQMFEINRTAVNQSSFSVLIKITGFTNINLLAVSFVAIDVLFPHSLNSFDNVPINYMAGALVNISAPRVNSIRTYRNIINFTLQSSGQPYRQFSTPLQNNKILLFLTSFFHYGTNQPVNSTTVFNRLSLQVDYNILTNQTYQLIVKLGVNNQLDKLHFSMIIFDQVDVQRSGIYLMVYQRKDFTKDGGFISIPVEFKDNFIIGITNLTSFKTRAIIYFRWSFGTVNGTHGVVMPVSVPTSLTQPPASSYGFSYLYLKTWICPNDTFFDPSINLCTACPIVNCINCLNLTVCDICDQDNDFYLNQLTGLCQPCSLIGCINCSLLNTSFQICVECNVSDNYRLINDSLCQQCQVNSNYYLNVSLMVCQLCSLEGCLNCSSLTSCIVCNENNSFVLGNNSLCEYCNSSENIFVNITDHSCQLCSIQGCLRCSSLSSCSICNQSNNYFLSSSQCDFCSIANCTNCLNLTHCQVCNSSVNTVLNQTTGLCESCLLQGCLQCLTYDICLQCDVSNGYGLDFTSRNRSQCGPCNVSCSCNGFFQPWNASLNQCSSLCGDGLIRINEQCDDGNLLDFDGCSSNCKVQFGAACAGQPSICNTTDLIQVVQYKINKFGCNQFSIELQLSNENSISLQQISIQNRQIQLISVQTLSMRTFLIKCKISSSFVQQMQLKISHWIFQLKCDYFRPLVFYSAQQCGSRENIKELFTALSVLSYGIMLASLVSFKIIGLELFGVLQLSYFTLISHQHLNLYLEPLASLKYLNGLNFKLNFQIQPASDLLKYMDISPTFINNCNFMFLLMLLQLLISIVLFTISVKRSNKKLQSISLRMLKQGFMTIFMFNLLNLSFSSGISVAYSNKQSPMYHLDNFMIFLSLLILFGNLIAFFVTEDKQYGQFHNKFKKNMVCRSYIPLQLLYRTAIGIYCGSSFNNEYSTLLVLSLGLVFVFYHIVNLPFISVLHNYRAGLIHLTQIVILLTTNYYRVMKSNTPILTKAHLHSAAILQIALIILCVFFSLAALIFEIKKDIVKWCLDKKKMYKSSNTVANQSLATLQ